MASVAKLRGRSPPQPLAERGPQWGTEPDRGTGVGGGWM